MNFCRSCDHELTQNTSPCNICGSKVDVEKARASQRLRVTFWLMAVSVLIFGLATAALLALGGGIPKWHRANALPGQPYSLNCFSATRCELTGSNFNPPNMLVTDNGGRTWNNYSIDIKNFLVLDISCPMAGVCVATGDLFPGNGNLAISNEVVTTVDGGRHWYVTSNQRMVNLACFQVDNCIGLSNNGEFRSTDGGGTWIRQDALPKLPNYAWSWCFSNGCIIELSEGYGKVTNVSFLTSDDRVHHWHLGRKHPIAQAQLQCSSISLCFNQVSVTKDGYRVTTSLEYTTDAGNSWKKYPNVVNRLGIKNPSIVTYSCATADDCTIGVASNQHVDRYGYVDSSLMPVTRDFRTTDGGRTWFRVRIGASDMSLQELFCSSPSTCIAIEQDVLSKVMYTYLEDS